MRSFCACPLRKRAETPCLLSGFRNPPYLFLSLLSYPSTFLCLYRQQIQTECVIYMLFSKAVDKAMIFVVILCSTYVSQFHQCSELWHLPYTSLSPPFAVSLALQVHAFICHCQSVTFSSIIHGTAFHLVLVLFAFHISAPTKYIELLTFSHSAVSNTLFI